MSNEETVEQIEIQTPPNADPGFGAASAPEAPALPAKREPALIGDRGIQIRNLKELAEFSKITFDSGLAPKSFRNAQAVAIAIQKGMEHRLTPLAAMHSVYVVNGMPTWTGKAALGLVFASGLMVSGSYRSWVEGSGDSMVAYAESRRVGGSLVTTRFGVDDARTAKLWAKKGRDGSDTPWITYPKRMLLWKAISHHMTDVYPDVLGNMPIAEDAIDIPATPVERKSLLLAEPGRGGEDSLLGGVQA